MLGAVACLAMIALGALRVARATPAGRRVISGPVIFGALYLGLAAVSMARSSEKAPMASLFSLRTARWYRACPAAQIGIRMRGFRSFGDP